MLEACKYARLPNDAGRASSGAEFCSRLFKVSAIFFFFLRVSYTATPKANPSLTISYSNKSCFAGVPLAQVIGSTCSHPSKNGGDGSSSTSSDDSQSSLVGITGTLLVLVALLIIGLLAATFWVAYRKWREHKWLWRTEPDDPDDIPMEEMAPPPQPSTSPQGSSIGRPDSPPVNLYLSHSGGIPVHISEPSDDEEKEL